jgi:hypothetical protein
MVSVVRDGLRALALLLFGNNNEGRTDGNGADVNGSSSRSDDAAPQQTTTSSTSPSSLQGNKAGKNKVLGLPDLMSLVAPYLGEGGVFPFALTSKACYFGTKGSGMQLRSEPAQFCHSVPMMKLAIGDGCEVMELRLNAAQFGHLEPLMWLSNASMPPFRWEKSQCLEDERTCLWAASGGQLKTLQWLRTQRVRPSPWDERTCGAAAEGGHLECLQWLRAQDPPAPWCADTCAAAAQHGKIDILHWLRSQSPPCPWNVDT